MTDDMQREAFEKLVRAWPSSSDRTLVRDENIPGYYKSQAVQGCWEGWKLHIRHMREQEDKA